MVIALIAILVIVAIAAILEENLIKYKWHIYICMGIFLILIATFPRHMNIICLITTNH